MGSSPSVLGNCPASYQRLVEDLEKQLLDSHIASVKLQNKIYFENKARELLERRKEDSLSFAAANLLFKNLNLKMENFLTSPLPTKDNGSAKGKSQ